MSTIQPRPNISSTSVATVTPDRHAPALREVVTVRWRVFAGGLSKVLSGIVAHCDEHGEAEVGLTVTQRMDGDEPGHYDLAAWITARVNGDTLRVPIAAMNTDEQDIIVHETDASLDIVHVPSGQSWLKATRAGRDDSQPLWAQSEGLMNRLELGGGQYHLVGA